MKHAGFKADEAMGWLRIVRPGSVIGQQQHFLRALESQQRFGVGSSELSPAGPSACPSREQPDFTGLVVSPYAVLRFEPARAADLAAQVTASMCSRGVAKLRDCRAGLQVGGLLGLNSAAFGCFQATGRSPSVLA
jgi:hypothetical protein